MEQFFLFEMWVGMRRINVFGRFEAWIWSMDGKKMMMKSKLDRRVLDTVRPIAGSLLVAGALFCLGLMSVHAQTVDANTALTYVIDGNSVTVTDCEESASGALVIPSSYNGNIRFINMAKIMNA